MPGTSFTPSHAAATALANLNAFVNEEITGKAVEMSVYLAAPHLQVLKGLKETQSGPNITMPMQVRPTNTTRSFKGLDARQHNVVSAFDTGVLQWANYETQATFDLESLWATGTQGTSGNKWFANHMKAAAADHGDTIANALYMDVTGANNASGNAVDAQLANGINGFHEIANAITITTPGSAKYAGLQYDATNYPQWFSQYDSSLTVANNDNINKLFQLIEVKGGKAPTHALTTRTNYQRLFAQNQAAQIVAVDSEVNAGFNGLRINGVLIMKDIHCPGNVDQPTSLFINNTTVTNPLKHATTGYEYFFAFNKDALKMVVFPGLDANLGTPYSLDPAGMNGVAVKILSRCNLACSVRRQVGVAIFQS